MQRKRLLCVDDDAAILTIIGKVAEELGMEVETISNSTRFMIAYVRIKPDIVTLDMMMPDVDGIELVRWMGDVGSSAHVIIISGGQPMFSNLAQKLAAARGSLQTSILRKPFSIADLRETLSAASSSAAF